VAAGGLRVEPASCLSSFRDLKDQAGRNLRAPDGWLDHTRRESIDDCGKPTRLVREEFARLEPGLDRVAD
jgi:hypothetical protein